MIIRLIHGETAAAEPSERDRLTQLLTTARRFSHCPLLRRADGAVSSPLTVLERWLLARHIGAWQWTVHANSNSQATPSNWRIS